jgi:hypothetical protein
MLSLPYAQFHITVLRTYLGILYHVSIQITNSKKICMPTLLMCAFLPDIKYTIKLNATEILHKFLQPSIVQWLYKVLTPFQIYFQSHCYSWLVSAQFK